MGLHSNLVKIFKEKFLEKAEVEFFPIDVSLVIFDLLINLMGLCNFFTPSDITSLVTRLIQIEFDNINTKEVVILVDGGSPKEKNAFKERNQHLRDKGIIPYQNTVILSDDGIKEIDKNEVEKIDPERFKLSRCIRPLLMEYIIKNINLDFLKEDQSVIIHYKKTHFTRFTSNNTKTEEIFTPFEHLETDITQWYYALKSKGNVKFMSSDSDIIPISMNVMNKDKIFYWHNLRQTFDLMKIKECLETAYKLDKNYLNCISILCGCDYFDVSAHKDDNKIIIKAGIKYQIGDDKVIKAIQRKRKHQEEVVDNKKRVKIPINNIDSFKDFIIDLYNIHGNSKIKEYASLDDISSLREYYKDKKRHHFPTDEDIDESYEQFKFGYNYWQCKHLLSE